MDNCPLSYVPDDASVSVLSILNCPLSYVPDDASVSKGQLRMDNPETLASSGT
jgi:hypothetical protein